MLHKGRCLKVVCGTHGDMLSNIVDMMVLKMLMVTGILSSY